MALKGSDEIVELLHVWVLEKKDIFEKPQKTKAPGKYDQLN